MTLSRDTGWVSQAAAPACRGPGMGWRADSQELQGAGLEPLQGPTLSISHPCSAL